MAQQELESLRASGKKSLTKTDVASCAAETDRHTSVVYRPRLLKGLAASLDASTLHTRKQLASACAGPAGAVELTFVDGTAATADVVVGADGIFSVMRRHVLADRAAAEAPVAASFWDARNIVPMATARAKLLEPLRAALRARAGDDDATARQAVDDLFGAGDRSDAHRQWGWVGAGAMLLFDVHDGGEAAQVVICGEETDTEPWAERKRPLTRGFLEAHLGGWLPVLRDATIALMLDQASPTRWREWHSPRTSTYHRDRAVLVGDAAHATTPWQGAGAGMAFEDAVLLARLLGRVGARAHVGAALETFTESRLARCAAVVESSHGTGWILCGRRYSEGEEIAPGADLEPGRVGAALGGRWNLILAYRLDAACEEAVEKFMGKIQSN